MSRMTLEGLAHHVTTRETNQEIAALESQRDELLAACEAARDWAGLDGDGIDEPVLSQLKNAIAKAKDDTE